MVYASAFAAITQGSLKSGLMSAAQVGEYDLVLAMGTKLLEKWESRGFRRDILLSMALAQCGLATDTFAVQQVKQCVHSKVLVIPLMAHHVAACKMIAHHIIFTLLYTKCWHTVVHHQRQSMRHQQTVQSTAKYKSCSRSCARFGVMQAALLAQCISYTCSP